MQPGQKIAGNFPNFFEETYSPDVWAGFSQGLFRIDLLAILQKSLDRALFLYIFLSEVRSSGVRASITIVHIRKFYKM